MLPIDSPRIGIHTLFCGYAHRCSVKLFASLSYCSPIYLYIFVYILDLIFRVFVPLIGVLMVQLYGQLHVQNELTSPYIFVYIRFN